MDKVRLKFKKVGTMIFTGHLDLQKIMQKTLRRAELPIAYSQGFNPHMLLSFALAAPLGMTCCADCVDVRLASAISCADFLAAFNAHAPIGLCGIGATYEDDKCASVVSAASYRLQTDLCPFAVKEKTLAVRALPEIEIAKRSKGGMRYIDAKPAIFSIEACGEQVFMTLAASSETFLSPLALAKHVYGKHVSIFDITRLRLFKSDDAGGLAEL